MRPAGVDNSSLSPSSLCCGFEELARDLSQIGDVRGAELFIGVEIVSDREAKTPDVGATSRLVNGLRDRRVLISASGPGVNVLVMRPPLVFSCAKADTLLAATRDALTVY